MRFLIHWAANAVSHDALLLYAYILGVLVDKQARRIAGLADGNKHSLPHRKKGDDCWGFCEERNVSQHLSLKFKRNLITASKLIVFSHSPNHFF
jgi:hypothetical protein